MGLDISFEIRNKKQKIMEESYRKNDKAMLSFGEDCLETMTGKPVVIEDCSYEGYITESVLRKHLKGSSTKKKLVDDMQVLFDYWENDKSDKLEKLKGENVVWFYAN